MLKIAPVILALSSVTLHAAPSAPSWYPQQCAAIDYCASVERVLWVPAVEGHAAQVNITSLHGTATIQREFVVRASQDGRMHVCMRFDSFGQLEVTCLLVPASGLQLVTPF